MLGLPPMKPTLLWCRWNQQLVFNFYEKNPTVISAASKNLARNIDNDKWSDGWLTGWLVGTMSNMRTNSESKGKGKISAYNMNMNEMNVVNKWERERERAGKKEAVEDHTKERRGKNNKNNSFRLFYVFVVLQMFRHTKFSSISFHLLLLLLFAFVYPYFYYYL